MNDDYFNLEKELFAEITRLTVSNRILWNLLPGTEELILKANLRELQLTIEETGEDCKLSIEGTEILHNIVYYDQNLAKELLKLARNQSTTREADLPPRGSEEYNRNIALATAHLRRF